MYRIGYDKEQETIINETMVNLHGMDKGMNKEKDDMSITTATTAASTARSGSDKSSRSSSMDKSLSSTWSSTESLKSDLEEELALYESTKMGDSGDLVGIYSETPFSNPSVAFDGERYSGDELSNISIYLSSNLSHTYHLFLILSHTYLSLPYSLTYQLPSILTMFFSSFIIIYHHCKCSV